MTVEVMVLVLLPIRKKSLSDIGTCLPISAVPKVPDQSPRVGDLISTTTPGMALAFITSGSCCCSVMPHSRAPGASRRWMRGRRGWRFRWFPRHRWWVRPVLRRNSPRRRSTRRPQQPRPLNCSSCTASSCTAPSFPDSVRSCPQASAAGVVAVPCHADPLHMIARVRRAGSCSERPNLWAGSAAGPPSAVHTAGGMGEGQRKVAGGQVRHGSGRNRRLRRGGDIPQRERHRTRRRAAAAEPPARRSPAPWGTGCGSGSRWAGSWPRAARRARPAWPFAARSRGPATGIVSIEPARVVVQRAGVDLRGRPHLHHLAPGT